MTENVSITQAGPEDAQRLAILGARAFTAAYENHIAHDVLAGYVEHAFIPERLAAELADPAVAYLIAEADDREIGFVHLREGSDTPAAGARRPIELARLWVTTSWLERGVDTQLMQASLEEAERRGCDRIWLGIWQEDPRAIEQYARWGFREVGRQPFTMGGKVFLDVLMERTVSGPPTSTMTGTHLDEGAPR